MLGVAADARVLTAATGPQEPPQVVGAPADAPATNGPKRVRHPLPPARVPVPGPPVAIDVADAALVKKWGIRFQSMRLSAAGYMLDFRYSVVDARKAKPLFERKTKPVLRDEASGVQMAVPVPPKTGALRNSNDPKAGKTYFMFFANPGRFIARGNLVTVTIGDFRVSGIRVDGEPLTDTARR
jgi:hypothetical protein